MVLSTRVAVLLFGVLVLCGSLADGGKTHRPPPPGLDPDEDAAHRGKFQAGRSMWRSGYLHDLRGLRKTWHKIAPIYFYRRTCGYGEAARQVIVRIGQFDLERILRDEASQNTFLFYIRWLVELYYRRIVPLYRLEPKPVFIIDCAGLSWRKALANSFGINAVIGKLNTAFHSVTGKGIGAVFILNAPYGFTAIWNTVTSFISFRDGDVVLVEDETGQRQLLRRAGASCLWEGHGGKSKAPLEGSTVEGAISKFSESDSHTLENPDAVRLTFAVEDFPRQKAQEELQQKVAAEGSSVEGEDASETGTEQGDFSW